ncbi:MAG TPA: PAS domain-containing protein [Planctomycetaceae bacterium]
MDIVATGNGHVAAAAADLDRLRRSAERYEALAAATGSVVWIVDGEGRMTESHPAWEEFTGQTPAESSGHGWLGAFHPDDRERAAAWIAPACQSSLREGEFRVRRRDGQDRWVAVRGVPTPDGAGGVREWVVAGTDVTDRNRAESELRQSRTMLETVLDNIPLGVFWKDRESVYLGANAVAARASGFADPSGQVGKTDFDLPGVTREQAEFFRLKDREVIETGRPRYDILEPLSRPDGTTAWLNTNKVPLTDAEGNVIGVLGTWEDVTERIRSQEAVRRSELRFRRLFEESPIAAQIFAPDGRHLRVNRAWTRLWGVTLDDIPGYNVRQDEQLRSLGILPLVERAFAGEAASVPAVPYVPDRGEYHGERRWARSVLYPVKDPDGRVEEVVLLQEDVTDQMRVEEALRQSEAWLRALTDHLPAHVGYADRDLRFRFGNRAYLDWFGSSPIGRTMAEVLGEEVFEQRRPYVEAALRGETVRFEGPTRHRELGLRDSEVTYVPDVAGGEVRGFFILVQDVTERKRTEAALRDAEEQFRTLADGIAQLAWTARPDGHIFWYNRRWYEYTGTMPESQEGWGWESVHDPAELPRVVAKWKAALATGEPWEDTFPLRRHDGEMRWHLSRAMPVRDAAGNIVRWFGTNTDVTDQRRAEQDARESRNLLQAIIDGSRAVIFAKDLEGRYFLTNRAWRELFDLTPEQAARATDEQVFGPEVARVLRENDRRVLEAGKRLDFEEQASVRGETVTYLSSKFPLRDADGRVYAVCGVSVDITAQKRAEDSLREADRRKDEFLATLGHELRNPLASIVGAAEAMAAGHGSGSAGDGGPGELLEIVERQARHMSRLIDDLLDVARIARGKVLLRSERVDLAELVRETAEDHRREIEGAGLTLAVEVFNRPLWVDGDRTRLAQVLSNLLHNAVKFTDAGGRIAVSVANEQGRAAVRVRDTGLGMSGEMLERIFTPFSQADASLARSRGGLGLGLALVKGLVELHGGTVAASSAGIGEGTEFVLRLPLASPPAAPVGAAAAAAGAGGRLRVLAIDDRRDVLRPLQILLAREGHEVEVATTGRSGVEAARRLRPDVVLCDIGLPGELNGHDVARELRAAPETRLIPLIALTGYGQESDRQAALAAGFDLHLTKPVDIRVLRDVLSRLTPPEPRT